MNLLCTGRGTSGSWQIRGVQLGSAIGATVDREGRSKGFDLTILVKRATPDVMARISGPIVHDIVDAWVQPAGNSWNRDQTMTWLRDLVARVRPVGIVAATEQMALDCQEFDLPVLALPHHAMPGQELNPIRERVHVVGYVGAEHYLGKWRPVLERECATRGWRFQANPEQMADLDIVVALRDADGYPVRHFKSGVKLANAQGTGTPCILSRESGYVETASGAEEFVETEKDLTRSLDRLTDYPTRATTSRILQSAAPHLPMIAARYKAWLSKF